MQITQFIDPASAEVWKTRPEVYKQVTNNIQANNAKREAQLKALREGALRSSPAYQHLLKVREECQALQGQQIRQQKAVKATTDALTNAKQALASAETRIDTGGMDEYLQAESDIARLRSQLSPQMQALKATIAQIEASEKKLEEAKKQLIALYQTKVAPLADKLDAALKVAEALNEEIKFLSFQVFNVVDVETPKVERGFVLEWTGIKKAFDKWKNGAPHHMEGINRTFRLWK
jgi:chromosome segregation ATPase